MTVIGLTVALMIGGAVVTETVFGLPGVGNLVVSAVIRRDYPVIQGALLVVAAIYVVINFLIDLLYTVVDPRVKVLKADATAPLPLVVRKLFRRASCWRAAIALAAGGRGRRCSPAPLSGFDPNETAVASAWPALELRHLVRHRRTGPRPVRPHRLRRPLFARRSRCSPRSARCWPARCSA